MCHCRDAARVDFRLDARDSLRPYVLEINAVPGLSCESDLSVRLRLATPRPPLLTLALPDMRLR